MLHLNRFSAQCTVLLLWVALDLQLMELLKHKSVVPFTHMAVCVARGCYYNMSRRTKHTDSQCWCRDGHISPWPQAVVYLSNKNAPQSLKVRGCHVQKVTLKTKSRQVFCWTEPDIQGHRVKREMFLFSILAKLEMYAFRIMWRKVRYRYTYHPGIMRQFFFCEYACIYTCV